jgi:transposase InsO family protein
MSEPRSLLIDPFAVPELQMPLLNLPYVPSDPVSVEARAALDPFTRTLWERHEHALKTNKRKSLYGLKSLMPDSYYIHIVKELHQTGHLERSGLQRSDPLMYLSIKNKITRNVRFMLFDVDPATAKSVGLQGSSLSVPVLYIVKRTAAALAMPSPDHCKRVFPISQVRPLLERLHTLQNCRVVGIEKEVADKYIGVTRDAMRFFQQYCLTCKEHQPLALRQQIVRPIRSLHARHRYVIDLICMADCVVKNEGTYKYILTMVDHFSRYRWTAALLDKLAAGVLRELRQWWSQWGKPDILQSDNGAEFAAAEVKELCRLWGVKKRRSRPYKPSTNGSVERSNRDIEERLARWLTRHPGKGWVEGLSTVTQAHNSSWTRCHRGKPCDVFTNPPPQWRLVRPDASMLPVDDWSDEETDTEADRDFDYVTASLGDDEDEDKEEEGDDEDVLLSIEPESDTFMVCDDGSGAAVEDNRRIDVPMKSGSVVEEVGGKARAIATERQQPVASRDVAPLPGLEDKRVLDSSASSQDSEGSNADVVIVKHPLMDSEENSPDEPTPPLDTLGVIPTGQVGGMRYPQWKRISEALYDRLGRAGVPGLGDCGVIAPLAAHQSYHLHGKSAAEVSDAVILQERNSALQFLSANTARVENEERLAVNVDVLRSTIRGLRNHVAIEYLWLYAMQHHVNIYLIELSVVKRITQQETRSTFSMRLITSERGDQNHQPIASDKPNTIAIYFHNIRSHEEPKKEVQNGKNEANKAMQRAAVEQRGNLEEKKVQEKLELRGGLGHFEFLVDKQSGESCWRTEDDMVKNVLHPAMEEAYRIEWLNNYTQRWSDSHNQRTTARLPKIPVGDIAMLMISDYMRHQSDYDAAIDGVGLRNMVVKVIGSRGGPKGPIHYQVLSHAGVVVTWPLQQEFRLLGQDVDEDLRAREVTANMRRESEKVGLRQAWEFFLQRRRSRHIEMMQRQADLFTARASQPESTIKAVGCSSDDAVIFNTGTAVESENDAAVTEASPTDAVVRPTFIPICCSCQQTIHLSPGREPTVCMGLCQQPMHGNPGVCKESNRWVRVGNIGVCCSKHCAVLFVAV